MVKTMAENPLILALANPVPEITPDEAKAVRPDAIVCTGRSDFPNQVNNVLCFPFLFRGALDVGATAINEEMKLAASHAIASLAKEPVPLEILLIMVRYHWAGLCNSDSVRSSFIIYSVFCCSEKSNGNRCGNPSNYRLGSL